MGIDFSLLAVAQFYEENIGHQSSNFTVESEACKVYQSDKCQQGDKFTAEVQQNPIL